MSADVVGASIVTTESGQVFDVFFIQDASGAPYGQDNAFQRDELVAYLREVATGDMSVKRRRNMP